VYVRGVSTRDMAGVTEALLGKRVGKSTVSRVTKRLEDLRRQPITEPFAASNETQTGVVIQL
jgi:transposase-like protein